MKIMFNEDWVHFLSTRYKMKVEVTEEYLRDFIRQYRDTQITDFSLNVNGRLSSFPSKVLQSFSDKYPQKTENGKAVDYSDSFARLAYNIFIEKNLDMYQIWIDSLREINIRPWISVRFNDCHTGLFLTEFYNRNPNLRRVNYREACGYFDNCFDYSHSEIRTMMTNYIREAMERYDVYGLEIDFTRELMSFKPGFETQGIAIMNRFMGDVKSILQEAGRQHGHNIKLSVLVNASPETNYNSGFDVTQWAADGLIDIVVALPRWETVNADIPVQIWKKLLTPYGVKFAAGHQILLSPYPGGKVAPSCVDTVIGNTATYLTNGADFTYLYNYMDHTETLLPNSDFEQNALKKENLKKIFRTVGDKQLACNSRRRHVLTYNDYPDYWERITARLPIECHKKEGFESARVPVGEIPTEAEVYVIMGVSAKELLGKDDFEIYVNCQPVFLSSIEIIETNVCDDPGYAFKIENHSDIMNYAVIEFRTTGKSFDVNYIEIFVNPGLIGQD
jgi:hypothetical protein